MVDPREVEKWKQQAAAQGRETWYLSWAMDLDPAEREKGKTVETGRAFFQTSKRRFTILDAPGHAGYIPAMIEGAAQADVGILVVSARTKEFEAGFDRGGQTREHAMISRTAGVSKLLVVITKMGDDSVKWSQARYTQIVNELTPYLKSCGFVSQTESDVLDFIPIDGYLGVNVSKPMDPSVCSWYEGPCLFEKLENISPPKFDAQGPVRFPILDKFKNTGLIVSGKLESGTVKQGQNLIMMPEKQTVNVDQIIFEGRSIDSIEAGESVDLKLKGATLNSTHVGSVLCSPNDPILPIKMFKAQMMILKLDNIMTSGWKGIIHIGASTLRMKLKTIHSVYSKKQKQMIKQEFGKRGDILTCRIQLEKAICVEAFNKFSHLGRFMVRADGKLIAVGKVLKVLRPKSSATTSTSSSSS